MTTQNQDPTQPPAAVTVKRADITEEATRWCCTGLWVFAAQVVVLALGVGLIVLLPAGPVGAAVGVGTKFATTLLAVTVAFCMGNAFALIANPKPRRPGPNAQQSKNTFN